MLYAFYLFSSSHNNVLLIKIPPLAIQAKGGYFNIAELQNPLRHQYLEAC